MGRERRTSYKSQLVPEGGFTSILNVPATQGSLLASRVRDVLQETSSPQGLRPGVQERPGRSVVGTLTKANPFPRPSCGRQLCPWSAKNEDCNERCYRENICYKTFCNECWREKEQALDQGGTNRKQQQQSLEGNDIPEEAYIKEKSKFVVTRMRTHLLDYRQAMAKASRRRGGDTRDRGEAREEVEGEDTSSWMADHVLERHGGQASENPLDDFESTSCKYSSSAE